MAQRSNGSGAKIKIYKLVMPLGLYTVTPFLVPLANYKLPCHGIDKTEKSIPVNSEGTG